MSRRTAHRSSKAGVRQRQPRGETTRAWSAGRWPYAAIAIAAAAAYSNALNNPFIFDDTGAILDNPTIRDIGASIGGGAVQSATAGRPLVNLTFAINYALGGTTPFGYHVGNLSILILCGWLLCALVARTLALPSMRGLGGERALWLAAAAATIWVVHPLNSEIVNYVTQRTEALMALAYLTTLYCGLRAMTEARSARWAVASVAACAAGMTCKESMVTAPVAVLLFDAAFVSGGLAQALRRRPTYYAGLAATWIVLAVLIAGGPRWRSAGFFSGIDPWTYLLNQAPLLLRYLRLLVYPVGLVLDYGEPRALTLADVWLPATIVSLMVTASLALWRWNRAAGFAATAVFLLLSPTSSIVPIATEVGAERRMFLPSAFLVCLLVVAGYRLLRRFTVASVGRWQLAVPPAVVVLLLGGVTLQRNAEYHSALRIWETSLERWPTGRARYNVGLELNAAGRRAEALEQYRPALPDSPDAHYALGFEMQADGRYAEAEEHYRTYIRLKPNDINVLRAYHQLGRTLLAEGKHEEALTAFREVLVRRPGDIDATGGVADAFLAMERWSDAIAAYQEYLRLKPSAPAALFNTGLALVRLDRDAEARDLFARVVQMQPDNVAAHVNLAYALANTGNYGDSVRHFRQAAALEKDPAMRADIEAAIGELLGAH